VRNSAVTEWARGSSSVHRRNSTYKLCTLLIILIAVATCPPREWLFPSILAVLLIAFGPVASLPVRGLVVRAAVIVAFVMPFAVMIALIGDQLRAITLVLRTYCCAVAIVTYAGVTPVPDTIAALYAIKFPSVLVEVIQFIYRYLFVIGEQARSMNIAAACRGAGRISASAGTVATLFARSYARAEAVHRAMLSRGYRGTMPVLHRCAPTMQDFIFLAGVAVTVTSLRLGLHFVSK
jgi:cobalt/nickel transport system permease protein